MRHPIRVIAIMLILAMLHGRARGQVADLLSVRCPACGQSVSSGQDHQCVGTDDQSECDRAMQFLREIARSSSAVNLAHAQSLHRAGLCASLVVYAEIFEFQSVSDVKNEIWWRERQAHWEAARVRDEAEFQNRMRRIRAVRDFKPESLRFGDSDDSVAFNDVLRQDLVDGLVPGLDELAGEAFSDDDHLPEFPTLISPVSEGAFDGLVTVRDRTIGQVIGRIPRYFESQLAVIESRERRTRSSIDGVGLREIAPNISWQPRGIYRTRPTQSFGPAPALAPFYAALTGSDSGVALGLRSPSSTQVPDRRESPIDLLRASGRSSSIDLLHSRGVMAEAQRATDSAIDLLSPREEEQSERHSAIDLLRKP